jgi:hypothetical protein
MMHVHVAALVHSVCACIADARACARAGHAACIVLLAGLKRLQERTDCTGSLRTTSAYAVRLGLAELATHCRLRLHLQWLLL